jgi:transcriptional regulator of aromatic amino acid metabolism
MANFAVRREILEALTDPVVSADGKRDIIAANAAARGIFPGDSSHKQVVAFMTRSTRLRPRVSADEGPGR